MDDFPSRPYCIGIIILCMVLAILASIAQSSIDEDEVRKTNQTLATTRWLHIFCGFWFVQCGIQFFDQYQWLIAIVLIYVFTLICIQLPKRWIHQHPAKWPIHIYQMFEGIFYLFSLPTQITTFFEEEDISEEEIREMIKDGSESGHIDQAQNAMIENIFEMDDVAVEEICTHRSEVISLNLDQDIEVWHQIIHDHRHTFYPVYKDDEDNVIGLLDTRDYFRMRSNASKEEILKAAVDEPFFVAESTKIDHLFKEMTARKNYFAIVLDEYGGLTGICTLHDIMESLVGEIYEEDEIDTKDIQRLDQYQWRIHGRAELEDVEEALHIDLHDEEDETFNGYILSQYGHIPEDGSHFEVDTDQMRIIVREVKNHRIGQTIVELRETAS